MIGRPPLLYDALGVMMLAVAAYGMVLLVTMAAEHRSVGRDVEISHVAMGVAMAGMFVPAWSFGPDVLWELIFVVLLVWFTARSVQSVRAWGLHVPHTAIHAVMSFAMLLMYWFPSGSSPHAMSMTASAAGGRIDPGLSFLIAFVLFGSAIFTVASPNKGASHFGTHGGARALVPASDGGAGGPSTVAARLAAAVATPSLVDASHVVMSTGMGLMLILMI
jgi:Domain of unknown function (DUF5134)